MDLEWKLLDEKHQRVGYRTIARRCYQLPDGQNADFDIVVEGNTVCTLALTPELDIILVKEFRPGPNKVLLELPGGGVEPNEEPIDAAARELLEETGYAGDMKFVQPSWHSAYSTLRRFNFVATNCRQIQEAQGDGGHEFLETSLMPLADFKLHLKSGELTDLATAMIGLEFLGL